MQMDLMSTTLKLVVRRNMPGWTASLNTLSGCDGHLITLSYQIRPSDIMNTHSLAQIFECMESGMNRVSADLSKPKRPIYRG